MNRFPDDPIPLLPDAPAAAPDPCAEVVLRLRDVGDPLVGLGYPGRLPEVRLRQLLKTCLRRFGFREVGGGQAP